MFIIFPYRRMLGWLTVRSCSLYFHWIVTFNILYDSLPPYIGDLFSRFAPSVRPSRHFTPEVFAIPNFRTSTFRNSFSLAAIYFWHSLLHSVRSSPTIGILKGPMIRYLFDLEKEQTWHYLHLSESQCSFGSPWAHLLRLALFCPRANAHRHFHCIFMPYIL